MRTRMVILGVVVGALVSGTVAWAAIPNSSTGVINACYGKSGAVRVIDAQAGASCAKGEQSLTWNQQGEQGPPGTPGEKGETGDQGDQGLPGVPGASGISHVYQASQPTVPGTMLPISLSVTLPAGRYLVLAKTFGDGSTSQAIGCYLRQRDAQNNIVDTVDFMWHNAFGAMIVLESAVEIPAGGGAVSLDCRSERADGTEGDPFPARTSKVVAIAVDAVN